MPTDDARLRVRRKGYAYEAAVAMRDWAFQARKLETLVSYIGSENLRSIRLAERLGATLDEHARPQDPGDLVYRHGPGRLFPGQSHDPRFTVTP